MSAVGSIAGGLVSGVSSLIGGSATNATNEKIAEQATQSNIEQADTTYQRGVTDLEAAGLNPVLAVSSGGDPIGNAQTAQVTNALGAAMQQGVGNYSALQTSRQTDPQIDQTTSSTNLNNALAAKAAADTTSALTASKVNIAQANNLQANTSKTQAGSWASDLVGTNAATKGSQYLNNAIDNVSSKVSSLINSVTGSSAYSNFKRGANYIANGFSSDSDSSSGAISTPQPSAAGLNSLQSYQ